MNPTTQLHELGQSLWLDNITRDLLVSGTLQRYVRDFAVSGLTSNPTIFDHAIRNTYLYDDAIRAASRARTIGRDTVLRTGARGSDGGRRSVPSHL